MSDTQSSSTSEEDSEAAAGGAASGATDTHPLLPGAKRHDSHDDDVLWCDACNEPVSQGTAGITEGESTCPKCRQKLRAIVEENTVGAPKVRTEVANNL